LTFTLKHRVKRQTPAEVKSASEAETICTTQFEQSGPYKTCQQHVGDLSNSSLSNCIKDVVVSIIIYDDIIVKHYISHRKKLCNTLSF
jgi:hypothetical protein